MEQMYLIMSFLLKIYISKSGLIHKTLWDIAFISQLFYKKKPIFTLKNWENEEQIRIHFQFNGNFKLGLFRFGNRKLLHLKQKSIKFQFTENELHGHKEILILSKNKEFIFYARNFFANVSKIF